ncbi:MAG: hypothetical protein AAFZ07_09470 [Actinomycetota bacterium]
MLLVVAGITFVVALAALDARATYGARTSADEPQYLLTALSLGTDLDLDISDEIAAEEFRPFHEVNLNPQTIELNDAGQRLSPHDPLLPAVLAVPMRVGGWAGAKAALAAIGALTAAVTAWVAVRRFGVDSRIAATVVTSAFVAPPLTSYATQVYPELPAGLCVVAGVGALMGRLDRRAVAVVVIAVVALPWLAVKYAPVAVVLALALLWRLRDRQRALAVVGGAFAVMGLVYLLLHQRIYGGWTVYAAGDHFVDGELLVVGRDPDYVGRSRRLVGLLIDRGFGLGAWTPSLLLLPAALVGLVRHRGREATLLVATFLVGWAVATWIALTMHGWWWPGRQVVVVLPLGIVALAVLVDRIRTLLVPVVVGSLIGAATWLWLVVEASTDRRTIIVDFESTANPWFQVWSTLLPELRDPGVADWARYLVWIVVLGLSCVAVWRELGRRPALADAQPASAISPPVGRR